MGALGCSECNKQEANNTRMRPTHGRSRLCGCVSMFCFHPLQCLFLFSTNQRLDEFAVVGFERLDLVSSPLVRRLCVFVCCIFVMLDLQDEGSSKQTCMVCVSPFHQNPVVNRDPTFLRAYQSIGQDRRSQTVAENRCFRLFGVQQMRHLVHCWALRMGNRVFAVVFGKGWLGLSCACACCSACGILNCQPFDLACFCCVVPCSDSRSFRPSHSCRT